jgi:hypothetical protein
MSAASRQIPNVRWGAGAIAAALLLGFGVAQARATNVPWDNGGSVIMNGDALNTAGPKETAGALTLRQNSITSLAESTSGLPSSSTGSFGSEPLVGSFSTFASNGDPAATGAAPVYSATGTPSLSSSQFSQNAAYIDSGLTTFGGGYAPDPGGQVVAMPEPATWATAAFAFAAIVFVQRHRLTARARARG